MSVKTTAEKPEKVTEPEPVTAHPTLDDAVIEAAAEETEADVTAAQDAEENDPPAGDAEESRGPRVGRSRLLAIAVLLALAAAVCTATLQWREAERLTDQNATRHEIRTTAGGFGQALLSYQHANLQSARDRVLSLATEDFAKTYKVAFTEGLQGVITKMQADAKATVRDVYVSDIDSGRAKAVVVLDSEVRSKAGTRRVIGSYLQMDLVLQKGKWRINQVASIGAMDESTTKPDGSTEPKKGGGTSPTGLPPTSGN